MSHEIEIREGQAQMMYAGQVPWHGLGTAVEREVTSEAAIRLAGLDWLVEKRPMYLPSEVKVDDIPVPEIFCTGASHPHPHEYLRHI